MRRARMLRAAWRAWMVCAGGLFFAACDPDPPDDKQLPPAIPGTECTPNEQRCADGGLGEKQVCRADGRGWIGVPCLTGTACNPGTGACESEQIPCSPGAAQCTGSPGTAARSVCTDDGNGWISEPCLQELVCEASSGACVSPVCDAGASRCDGGDGDPARSVCAASRLAFEGAPCPSDTACVASADGSKCVSRICEPGSVACSGDFTAVLSCDLSGTTLVEQQACLADQACVNGACVAATTTLGGVTRVDGTSTTALVPGRYSFVVVSTDLTSDDTIPFPVSITGALKNLPPPASPAKPMHAPSLHPSSGTPALLAHRLPVLNQPLPGPDGPVPTDLDERVFHVPDYDSGGTIVIARTARLRASGQHVNLWEDQTTGAPGHLLPDASQADLLARIDNAVLTRNASLFGAPTDVDGNGKIDIVFTDVISPSVAAFVSPFATLLPAGTYGVDYDHGEIVYSQGMTGGMEPWEMATLLAHETAHLAYFGRRLTPYMADPSLLPDWIDADVYASEGLASLAMGWSGQSYAWPMVDALEAPQEMSLWRMVAQEYIQESTANLVSYGFSALVQEYLFEQAGGVKVQGAGSVLADAGGVAYLDAFTTGESGWDRIAPLDGRTLSEWYGDFAAALLVSTLDGKVSDATKTDPRYAFAAALEDTVYGGWLGPTLRYDNVTDEQKTGPILQRTPWSLHSTELRRGGLSFVTVAVEEPGATFSLTGDSNAAIIVRHVP